MKKTLLVSCVAAALFISVPVVSFAEHDAPLESMHGMKNAPVISGKVIETMNAGGYTYAQIEYMDQKVWLAMPETKLKVGETATFYAGPEMRDFKSDSLKRKFDRIIFTKGLYVLPGSKEDRGVKGKKKQSSQAKVEKVEKAQGSQARTVAEVYKDKASLNGMVVSVRGKVVKVSKQIMGNNWVHIQDGTGDASQGTNNLVVTTQDDTAAVGDTVTATGIIASDKDFGFGYKYDVIMEQAEIKK